MARTRSAGASATTAQVLTPPPAPEATNPLALAAQPSAGTGADESAPEVEHIASRVFEVSLEGLGASTHDIESPRRIQALITGKAATKDTGPHHWQGRRSPTRAGSSIVCIPSIAAPAVGHGTDVCNSRRHQLQHQAGWELLHPTIGENHQCTATTAHSSSTSHPHQQPLRRLRRRLNSTSGTLCRPCKLS
jgi:hypothetical protein